MAVRTAIAALLAAPTLAIVGVTPVATSAQPAPVDRTPAAEPRAAAEGADCVTWEARAVYGALGYDHRVTLRNGCEKDARCTVTTDVNPEPQSTTVAKGATETVVTFRGSPAREFTATVECTLTD